MSDDLDAGAQDIHTEPASESSDPSPEASLAKDIEMADMAYGLSEGNPIAIVEFAAAVTKAVLDPHGREVMQHLGEYGGTLPPGGAPGSSSDGSSDHQPAEQQASDVIELDDLPGSPDHPIELDSPLGSRDNPIELDAPEGSPSNPIEL